MAKIVRLTGVEQRKWTRNVQIVLNEDGSPLREVTQNEERVIVELTRHMRVKRTSARARTPGESSTVSLSVEKDAGGRPTSARFTIDGLELTDTKSVMRAEMLARHGECQLRWTNGKVLCVIRDPSVRRPTAKEALRSSVSPDSCPCKNWGDPHPGRHHRVCQQNEKAPPEERGDIGADGPVHVSDAAIEIEEAAGIGHAAGQRLLATGATVGTVESAPVVKSAPKAHAPAECPNGCFGWVRHDGKTEGHHPICEHAAAWEAVDKTPSVLVDIDSGEVLRPATIDEIGEAEASEKRTGAATVKIGEQIFMVVPADEVAPGETSAAEDPAEAGQAAPVVAPPGPVEVEETA